MTPKTPDEGSRDIYGFDRIVAVLAGVTTLLPIAYIGGTAAASLAIRRDAPGRLMGTGILAGGFAALLLVLAVPLAAWGLWACRRCWQSRRDGLLAVAILASLTLAIGVLAFLEAFSYYPTLATWTFLVMFAVPLYAALRLTTLGPAPD